MDVIGNLIKAWVYKKTLFYLVKMKGVNQPVVINSRKMKKFSLNNDGAVKGSMNYNDYKLAVANSKQYFGNKAALAEQAAVRDFPEYDPFNEDSYLESPEDEMVLLGHEVYEEAYNPPYEGGVDPRYEPPDYTPGQPAPTPPTRPPPPSPPQYPSMPRETDPRTDYSDDVGVQQ